MTATTLSLVFSSLFIAAGLAIIVFAGLLSRFFTARFPKSGESALLHPTTRSFRFLGIAWVVVGVINLLAAVVSR